MALLCRPLEAKVAADIRGAVAVPVTLLAVMVAVVVLLMTQVLPVFDRVFAQLGVRMGAVATAPPAGADGSPGRRTGRSWPGPPRGCRPPRSPGGTGLAAWFRRSFGGRGVLGQMAVSRFASSMAMAVSSGMSMEESVDLSARLCGGAKAPPPGRW